MVVSEGSNGNLPGYHTAYDRTRAHPLLITRGAGAQSRPSQQPSLGRQASTRDTVRLPLVQAAAGCAYGVVTSVCAQKKKTRRSKNTMRQGPRAVPGGRPPAECWICIHIYIAGYAPSRSEMMKLRARLGLKPPGEAPGGCQRGIKWQPAGLSHSL